tara:strand:+ start:375 stop:494 length:120 start_codon:yes stop_codon:yes gene_type:complete
MLVAIIVDQATVVAVVLLLLEVMVAEIVLEMEALEQAHS